MATDGGGPADPDIQEAQHPYRAPASIGTEVTPASPAVKGSSAVATCGSSPKGCPSPAQP